MEFDELRLALSRFHRTVAYIKSRVLVSLSYYSMRRGVLTTTSGHDEVSMITIRLAI